MKCYLNKIIPFSSVDGPGNRTAIFLQGCNFDCVYCHNPETINHCINCTYCVSACSVFALSLNREERRIIFDASQCIECDACTNKCHRNSSPKVNTTSAYNIINDIKNYRPFIQGITVSGGECTLQAEFLIELFTKAKALGLTCFIDTNGSTDLSAQKELMSLCDGVMLDVKVWDNATHQKYIKANNEMVIKNLDFLVNCGKLYEVRTVVVPELFDNEETVREVSLRISQHNIRYKLIKYRHLGVRKNNLNLQTPTDEQMQHLKTIANNHNVNELIIV
ncbi:MAG TPA: YjjW family glycine radical enzyme activase [Firmicutes bacterium]|nr:YjjW family glycine radical enzyme activase [Bacillota bacterium]